MASELTNKKCLPCEGGVQPLEKDQITEMLRQVSDKWGVVDQHHLEATFEFKDFVQALEFTNQVGRLAEEEEHHPDIHLSWGRVSVTIWTHAIDGLSENDFILAAKIDELGV